MLSLYIRPIVHMNVLINLCKIIDLISTMGAKLYDAASEFLSFYNLTQCVTIFNL